MNHSLLHTKKQLRIENGKLCDTDKKNGQQIPVGVA